MRTAQKRDILDLINTLHQAQDEIKKNIESANYVSAQGMLGECQECAVSIGTVIEASEGEGFVTVSYIEAYCDVLYHIHEELNALEEINVNKIYKTLRKNLLKIENSIKNDVPVKKEMVFLPYKASMWDSLESVWRAADADPECDAYVVPIPYYDKNPDGSFAREYYEGNAFPADVPIVHYEEYDIAKRHPDAIFIHNPYDRYNYVTSIHPFFYSDKLKKYCDRLIYIPYYVSAEINPDAPDVIEDKSGMVLTSGVLNADMVVVQSENTKKLYLNILEKYFPEIDHQYWERKVQGLGSPKLDRAVSVQRDDARLPQKWREIIYTRAGVRKKTILYNVSISSLLANEDMLEKIKDVLAFFKGNQDTVLWWRPHPLYESTLASMRPALLEEYREIVRRYREEAWGIFDEGVDLEWAIAETDAYYGDRSSVVQLYKAVGKPVMYQNVSVRAGEEITAEDIPIWPSAFCVDGDDIWFVHGKMNVLMRYSMRERYTYIAGTIPNEKFFQESLYKGIYKWENKIFLIPCWAREITVYHMEDHRFEKIALKDIGEYDNKILFHKVYADEQNLYCIPYYYKAILKIDMASMNIEYTDILKTLNTHGMTNVYINDSTRIGDEIAAILTHTNQVLFYQMKSGRVEVKSLGKGERSYTNITNIGNALYLFDKSTNSIVQVYGESYLQEKVICTIPYAGARLSTIEKQYIMLDPSDDQCLCILDRDGNLIFKNTGELNFQENGLLSSYLCGVENDYCVGQDVAYYFNMSSCNMYLFKDGKPLSSFSMLLQENEIDCLKKLFNNASKMEDKENVIYDLKVWIKNKKMNALQKVSRENCGERVLLKVKNSF